MKPQKFFASIPTVKKIDVDKRTIEHVISTGSEDRDGDTINPKGWILEEYLKNPVVLFAHRHDLPPIGRALKLKAAADGLASMTQFPPAGLNQLADTVFEMNRLGYLRSWSVGFDPQKFTAREDGGVDFEEQKLLEYSSVPVPANAEAVNLAVSKGIMTEKMLKLFEWEKLKEQCGGYVPLEAQILSGFAVEGETKQHPFLRSSDCVIPKELSAWFADTKRNWNAVDIDAEKLQSCFDNGNAALQISGAHHARAHSLRKIISAAAGK